MRLRLPSPAVAWPAARGLMALAVAATAAACTSTAPTATAPAPALADVRPAERALTILAEHDLVVGVMPDAGGRIVLLRTAGGENVLHTDEEAWAAPIPPAALNAPFTAHDGSVVWVSPQSGWWTDQEVHPGRREAAPGWPPDPFLELDRTRVVEQTATRLVLAGNPSPVSGLQIERRIEIVGPRRLRVELIATNAREAPLSRGLWPNHRIDAGADVYLPVADASAVRLEHSETRWPGFFETVTSPAGRTLARFQPLDDPAEPRLSNKAFITPNAPLAACFLPVGNLVLIVRGEPLPAGAVHPEQGPFEVYRDSRPLLEVEHHGPFVTLAPGESTRYTFDLELRDYDGDPTPEARAAYVDRLLD